MPGIPRNKGWWRTVWLSTTPYDVLLAGIAIVPAIIAGTKSFDESRPGAGWLYYGAAFAALLITIVKASVSHWMKIEAERPHHLEGALEVLRAILMTDYAKGKNAGLRLTVHVPAKSDTLQQVLDYVGDDRGGKTCDRLFSIHCGATGKAFRERCFCTAVRQSDDHGAYIKEMVSEWGYAEIDAKKLDGTARSWMAVPLVNGVANVIEGIVYLDSTDKEFFTDSRKSIVLEACSGLAYFVARRYR